MAQKKSFEITCTDCGKTAMVPFKPTTGKPVYCRTCFAKRRSPRPGSGNTSFSFNHKNAWAQRGDNWEGRRKEKPTSIFHQS